MTATTPGASRTRALTYVWAALCALTILSWWLAPGHSGGPAVAGVPITLAVVLVAFVKGAMIIHWFMEARTAPRWLRVATAAWLTVLWVAILAIYLY